MAIYKNLSWRAITNGEACYIGMAASVAGGFVAVNAEGIGRETCPGDEFADEFANWED